MRKASLLATASLLVLSGAATGSTRTDLNNLNDAGIVENHTHNVTPTTAHNLFNQMINNLVSLHDVNVFDGTTNTFGGASGGSIWSDVGTGVVYITKVRDRLLLGSAVNGTTAFNAASSGLVLAPGDDYLYRGALFAVQHPKGTGGTLAACATSQITTSTPGYFTVKSATFTDTGGGTPSVTTFGVTFTGGHGTGVTADITNNSSGKVASIVWHNASASGYYSAMRGGPGVTDDLLTPSPYPSSLPHSLVVDITDTWTPGCIAEAISGINDNSNTNLPVPLWGYYGDVYHEAGAGATVVAEWHAGNGGTYLKTDPYTSLNYNTGATGILSLAAGGSSSTPGADYVSPISYGIQFGGAGGRIGHPIEFIFNAVYDDQTTPLHAGSANFMGMIGIAMATSQKIAFFSGQGNVGAYIDSLVSGGSIVNGLDSTNHGWVASHGLEVIEQEAPLTALSLANGQPLFEVLHTGANHTAAFEAYNQGASAIDFVLTRASTAQGGTPSNTNDDFALNWQADATASFAKFAVIDGIVGTVGSGISGGKLALSTSTSAGSLNQGLVIDGTQTVTAANGAFVSTFTGTGPTLTTGQASWQAGANGGLLLKGFGATDDIRGVNQAGTTVFNVPANTTNFNVVGQVIAASYKVGATAGASCTLTTVAHLTAVNGIVTLCN